MSMQIFTEGYLSDGETSDNGLEIVIESPNPKRKLRTINILPVEKEIIKSVEKEIDDTLDEKAAKSNLTANNVKNILKHVVTNEHVLAMVKHAEDPNNLEPIAEFEPTLTRAKAKELFSSQTVVSLPWITPKPPSEVHVLISDELQEDSSGDEYVPAEEESEDDREGSIISDSDPPSTQPPTPTNCDSSTQTNWSEDGIFKVPHAKTKEEEEEEANIARRTRSKLSLSSTPLEVIEEAFIPPDITTDMYDMDCDDDDWKDFLKKFTRPLDEVTKPAEDDEHDPEYNILADEEIDKVDKEELRADKAVKVTRKELNELVAELFEYADFYTSNQNQNKTNSENEGDNSVLYSLNDSLKSVEKIEDISSSQEEESNAIDNFNVISNEHFLLLQQQLRQHVQLMTQTFLLTFQHPEFYNFAITCKENLLNFKYLACDNDTSVYNIVNLKPAIILIEDWENKFSTNDDEVKQTKLFVAEVAHKVKESKIAGLSYIPTFPKMIFETMSKSAIFMYPTLLPRIPFKPTSVFANNRHFLQSEDELIAIGLEQFIPYLQKESFYLTKQKQVNLKSVSSFLAKFLIVTKDPYKLYRHIIDLKQSKYGMNPIKYYFEFKKAPPTMHYVVPLENCNIVAPFQQKLNMLPYQWREYLCPSSISKSQLTVNSTNINTNVNNVNNVVAALVSKSKRVVLPKATPLYSCSSRHKKRYYRHRSSTNNSCKQKLENYFRSPSQQKFINIVSSSKLKNLKFNSTIFKKMSKSCSNSSSANTFPNMPSLNAPLKNIALDVINKSVDERRCDTEKVCSTDVPSMSLVTEVDNSNKSLEKDNPEDINAFMVASSTMKSTCKREPSGAEKKRAKLRKEFTANLAMLSPEDPIVLEEKTNSYAQAYYDKVRECLDVEDYQKFIEILNNHDEKNDTTPHLYEQIEAILLPKYPDLADEFLTFLTPADAKAVGKLVPHFMLTNMSLFLRKLEIYFKDQPAQVRKIYHSLTELATCVNVTMENVKKTILPLLKGNSLLTDWFLQIFPCEKPTESVLNGTWENIDIPRNINDDTNEDGFETVVIPDMEDPFGGPNCSCSCHNVDDATFKCRLRHCVPCGTKFYQGRVYLQTGKLLRLAEVTFKNGTQVEHLERLNYRSVNRHKKRLDTSPNKQLPTSPVKDAQDEVRVSNDSEEDGEYKKKQKQAKTPRKSRVKVRDKITKAEAKKESRVGINEKIKKTEPIEEVIQKKVDKVELIEEVKLQNEKLQKESKENLIGASSFEQKSEETMEWDCNASVESVERKLSPEHSADSGSEFCEESSQDNVNSESDVSNEESGSLSNSPPHSENSNSNNMFDEMSWTRDEDKIILETFQREPDKDRAFKCIAEVLENRSVPQIAQRFQTLMNLLQQMVANCKD